MYVKQPIDLEPGRIGQYVIFLLSIAKNHLLFKSFPKLFLGGGVGGGDV
jgi:hypothetical protein